jgi:hypothetical protein
MLPTFVCYNCIYVRMYIYIYNIHIIYICNNIYIYKPHILESVNVQMARRLLNHALETAGAAVAEEVEDRKKVEDVQLQARKQGCATVPRVSQPSQCCFV